jgi:hypothetical protein
VNTRLVTARRLILKQQGRDSQEPQDETATEASSPKSWRDILYDLTGIEMRTCPKWKKGKLIRKPLPKGDVMLWLHKRPLAA